MILIILLLSTFIIAQVQNTHNRYFYPLQKVGAQSFNNYYIVTDPTKPHFHLINNINPLPEDNTRQRMDSIISNSITGGKLKMIFEYDNNDNIVEQFIGGWISGSGWFYDSRNELFYDENQKLILQLDLKWNSIGWDSSARINYSYNTQNQLIQFIYQVYNENIWENFRRVSFYYDLNGNEIQLLEEEWQNGWINKLLNTNYFSAINKRDSLFVQVWNSINWENYAKTTFSYNQQTQFLESFSAIIWNNGAWENFIRRKITNDTNGNQILQVDQIWNGVNWENSIRRVYTYDNLNYILTAYCELWNGNQWYLDDGIIPIKNPDGFSRDFDMNNVFIFYKTTSTVAELNLTPENFKLFQNYPNPFNSTTTIKYTIPHSGKVTLKIFDLMGSEVATVVDKYQTTGSYEVAFQTVNLSSGIYLYQIRAGKFIATKKSILIK